MTNPERISDERLREILAGCEGVTPGPWWGEPHYDEMERGCAVIAATPHGPLPGNPTRGMLAFAVQVDPANAKVAEADAAHIARLDPDTVRSIITELLELRKYAANIASPAEPAAHSLQTLAPASDAVKPGDET